MERFNAGRHCRWRCPHNDWRLRAGSFIIATMVALVAFAGASAARPSDGGICIDPDIEFPVPCDDDED